MGPTASGKTSLSLSVAEAVGGTLICGDSQQLYDSVPILTAAPTPDELARAPHVMFGSVPLDVAQPPTAFRWRQRAAEAADAIAAEGRVPIVVGGSHFYTSALLCPERAIGRVPGDADEQPDIAGCTSPAAGRALWAELAELRPNIAAQILPEDFMRVRRALSDARVAAGQANAPPTVREFRPTGPVLALFTELPPDADERIASRIVQMVADGLLPEAVAATAVDAAAQAGTPGRRGGAGRAIGLKELTPAVTAAHAAADQQAWLAAAASAVAEAGPAACEPVVRRDGVPAPVRESLAALAGATRRLARRQVRAAVGFEAMGLPLLRVQVWDATSAAAAVSAVQRWLQRVSAGQEPAFKATKHQPSPGAPHRMCERCQRRISGAQWAQHVAGRAHRRAKGPAKSAQ